MTQAEFERLLHRATTAAIDFARQFVTNMHPNQYRYYVVLNQSYDKRVASGDLTFPEDEGLKRIGLELGEVVELLYRQGRCPIWIDISVAAVEDNSVCIQLICAGRYTSNDATLYDVRSKMGPFGIKSPTLPIGYDQEPQPRKFLLPTEWHYPPKPRRLEVQ